jgi:hypothetical protein
VKNIRFVGLDVHAETVAVAVADSDGEVRSRYLAVFRTEGVTWISSVTAPLGNASRTRK